MVAYRSRFVVLAFLAAATLAGFPSRGFCCAPPGYGFIIRSQLYDYTKGPFPVISLNKFQTLSGSREYDDQGAQGDTSPFEGETDNNGLLSELGKRTPAVWDITWENGPCSIDDIYHPPDFPTDVTQDFKPSYNPQNLICYRQLESALTPDPSTVIAQSETNVTVTAGGGYFEDDPISWIAYDPTGNILGQGSVTDQTTDSCVCPILVKFTTYESASVYLLDSNGEGVGTFNLHVYSHW